MKDKIKINKVEESRLPEVDLNNIPFGKVFSDHMLVADYSNGKWGDVKIEKFQNLSLNPATSVLHYGQTIFEGLKAYKTEDGRSVIFRPYENFKRLNRSAERMCMPEIPQDIFIDGMKELIKLDNDWIPTKDGSSLYIRPFMIATDDYIGIKPSDNYKFIIFTCPVNAYYADPIKVYIEETYARAVKGGIGYAKAGGNYAASLYPASLAQQKGFRQLIWTDAKEHKYIEESGTMNIFFQIDGKFYTAPTDNGTILSGITRKSLVSLMKENGYDVIVAPILVEDVIKAFEEEKVNDVFGTGTAATLAPVSAVGFRDKVYKLPPVEERKESTLLKNLLNDIKLGRKDDKHNWLEEI